jgi:hypothetical protein
MAKPEHGIEHKNRQVKTYTREQILRKRNNFTPEQALTQMHRVRRMRVLLERAGTHPRVVATLIEEEKLWIEIRREAEARSGGGSNF